MIYKACDNRFCCLMFDEYPDFHPDNPRAKEIFQFLIKYLSASEIIMLAAIKSNNILENRGGICGLAIQHIEEGMKLIGIRNQETTDRISAMAKNDPYTNIKNERL